MKLFSVIVANYNNARYLPVLVDSMRKQDYANWELIIADDCSTDDSWAVLQQEAKDDARIKLVRHAVNRGAGACFKSAMDASSGELIGMLGADDALRTDALMLMAKAHEEHPGASMITSAAWDCDAELNTIGSCAISGEQPAQVSFIHEIHVGNFVTYKRSAYQKTSGFNPEFRRAVDHDIFLKLEEQGSLAFVPELLYYYRRHDGGISQGQNGMKAAEFSLRSRMDAYQRRKRSGYPNNLTDQEYKGICLTYHQRRVQTLRNNKEFRQALRQQWLGLKESQGQLAARGRFWKDMFQNTASLIFKG